MKWFKVNSSKANPGKFHFIVLGNKDERSFNIHIHSVKSKSSNEVALLGIKIDKSFTFKKHRELCRKASLNRLHTLSGIRKYLTVKKANLLENAFVNSQFNYAYLIWMLSNKSSIS